jgi:hypothetical protein
MSGASLAEAGHVLGHKSAQMTKKHAYMADRHIRGVVVAMNEQIFKVRKQ